MTDQSATSDKSKAPEKRSITLKVPVTLGDGAVPVTVIDLSGLDDLTGADVLFCRREAEAKSGTPVFYGIADSAYRLEVAAKASGLPVELFLKLKASEFERVDNTVKLFLAGTDSE